MGTLLFLLNFFIIFDGSDLPWFVYLVIGIVACVYIALIFKAIREPVGPLTKMTKEELNDHEYD